MSRGVFVFLAVTVLSAVTFAATIHVPSQQPTIQARITGGNSRTSSAGHQFGVVTDYDGNVYKTIRIGSQVWMAENLRVTHYSNGDAIPNVADPSDWANLSSGAYCNYANDSAIASIYGKLYNWYAATDSRQIAPDGWHVPDDNEFQLLVDFLGGASIAGGKMKDTGTAHWMSPNTGATNECGFTGLAGGGRAYDGGFAPMGQIGYFLTTSVGTIGSTGVLYRYLHYGDASVGHWSNRMGPGLAVRCVQDYPSGIESVSIGQNSAHVTTLQPVFSWQLIAGSLPQDSVQIEVGIDEDWSIAEMWNPAPFNSSDTFVTYAGGVLVDGQTYYLRLRISDGSSWSPWYYTSFRMNTPPVAPVLYAPLWPTQTSTTPDLAVVNSTDAENDSLWYDFEVYRDTLLTQLVTSGILVPEMHNPESTIWTVSPPLDDNRNYYWKVRAFDGYEYSAWSSSRFFTVNSYNEPPSAPWILDPPDSSGPILYNRKPMLRWWMSTDPDPYDQVHYRVQLATDSLFVFRWQQDSAWGNWTSPPDSLPYGGHYWWRLWAIDKAGAEVICPQAKDFWIWTLGDVDHSHNTDIADLSALIDYLYINFTPIVPLKVADVDGDCAVDIADLTRLIDYLYISFASLGMGCEP